MLTKLLSSIQKKRYDRAKELTVLIREGNSKAAKELIEIFNPLIRKTCKTLYIRYNRLVPMQDLLADGASLIVYLAGVEYDPNGPARIGRFMKTHLHARLVQMYRPIVRCKCHEVELKGDWGYTPVNVRISIEQQKENVEHILTSINEFMWNTFNERELDLILNHIMNDKSRDGLARRYHVSNMRMKQIHKKVIKRLRNFLSSRGINSMKDVYEKF